MYEAVKVALDPTPRQERLLEGHAGAARFAYNTMLSHVQSQLARGEKADWSMYAQRRWWNEWKNEIAPWWAQYSKEAYNSAFESLAAALRNFFDAKTGRRKGKRMGWPGLKSKRRSMLKFAYTTGSFGLIDNDSKALKLPRIGRVHCMEDIARRVGDAKVVRMSVSRHAGRWYASLTVERGAPSNPCASKGGAVGVDLGVKTLATLSDGTGIANPRHLKRGLRALGHAQRALGRRQEGSRRWSKAKARVQRAQARIAAQRHDGLHKLTDWLTRTYADISIEDLNVAGMVSNHRLAQAVSDCGFAELRRQLVYKSAHRRGHPHHRPLVPIKQDMLELRDGESQTVPQRTNLLLRCLRFEDRPRPERGHQHQRRRECPGDAKRARRGRKTRPACTGRADPSETRTKQRPPRRVRLGAALSNQRMQTRTN